MSTLQRDRFRSSGLTGEELCVMSGTTSLLNKELRQTCMLLGIAASLLGGYLGLAMVVLRVIR